MDILNSFDKIVAVDVTYKLFFLAIVFDFITGVIVAAKNGKLRSRTCSDGLFRSIGELLVLSIMLIINNAVPTTNAMITTLAIGFIFKEGLSICENLVKLGVWIPSSFKKMLEVGVDKVDKGE